MLRDVFYSNLKIVLLDRAISWPGDSSYALDKKLVIKGNKLGDKTDFSIQLCRILCLVDLNILYLGSKCSHLFSFAVFECRKVKLSPPCSNSGRQSVCVHPVEKACVFKAEGKSTLESNKMIFKFLDVIGHEDTHCCCCLNSHNNHFSKWVRCHISDSLYASKN